MAENESSRVRGPGRPQLRSDEQTRELIVAAAAHAFMKGGYLRTGVDTIARLAGVSTRTLYRLFATKEDLLREAMEARIDAAFSSFDRDRDNADDPRTGLEALLDGYAELALSEEAVEVTRLIAAERHDVPGLVDSYRQATARVTDVFDAWVEQHQQTGRLRADLGDTAAQLLRGMVNEAQRQLVLGLRPPLSDEERHAWVKAAVSVFLRGCAEAA